MFKSTSGLKRHWYFTTGRSEDLQVSIWPLTKKKPVMSCHVMSLTSVENCHDSIYHQCPPIYNVLQEKLCSICSTVYLVPTEDFNETPRNVQKRKCWSFKLRLTRWSGQERATRGCKTMRGCRSCNPLSMEAQVQLDLVIQVCITLRNSCCRFWI